MKYHAFFCCLVVLGTVSAQEVSQPQTPRIELLTKIPTVEPEKDQVEHPAQIDEQTALTELPTVEPEKDQVEHPAQVDEQTAITELNPSTGATGIVSDDYVETFYDQNFGGGVMTYQQIANNSPSEYRLQTDNEYLAEYLRQNPDVSWWRQDTAAQTIESREAPVVTGKIVDISPSGGNDTTAIRNAISKAGAGGVVDGGGQLFKASGIKLLSSVKGITIRNMAFDAGGSILFTVNAPDVTMINLNIDFNNREIYRGITVSSGGDRFSLVGSTLKNGTKSQGTAAFLSIDHGVEDVYIVNNNFLNLTSRITANTKRIIVRGMQFLGKNGQAAGVVSKRGITASNFFENLQSNEQIGRDADTFVAQGFALKNQFDGRHLFIANIGINAGKRMLKAQSGGIDAHSNFNWWKDDLSDSGLGERETRAHYDAQSVSDLRWTNNAARTDHVNQNSESMFMAMATHGTGWVKTADYSTHDIVFDNNIYELNATTAGNSVNYWVMIIDWDGDLDPSFPERSSFQHNVTRRTKNIGNGEYSYYYWSKNGANKNINGKLQGNPAQVDPFLTLFPHTDPSEITIPATKTLYRIDTKTEDCLLCIGYPF